MAIDTTPRIQPDVDGYISYISLYGKKYALRSQVVEVYPITCPKCGASFELKCDSGQCPHCETYYTTEFKLVETTK